MANGQAHVFTCRTELMEFDFSQPWVTWQVNYLSKLIRMQWSAVAVILGTAFFFRLVTKHTTYMSWSWLTKISWWIKLTNNPNRIFWKYSDLMLFPMFSWSDRLSDFSVNIQFSHKLDTIAIFRKMSFSIVTVNWRNWWLKCFDYELLIDEKLQSSRVIK